MAVTALTTCPDEAPSPGGRPVAEAHRESTQRDPSQAPRKSWRGSKLWPGHNLRFIAKSGFSPGEILTSPRVAGVGGISCPEEPITSSSESHTPKPRTICHLSVQPTETTEDPGDATPLKLNRDFRLLLRGSSVSMLGSRVSAIAYPLLVLAMTSSPVVAGWACFATIAPSIIAYLPAGALVDRWAPRRAMLLSEFGQGIATGAIVVGLVLHRLSVPALVALGATEQVLEVFSVLAERRLVRSVVELEQAASALAKGEAWTHIVVLVGRPLGALFFGAWRVLPFLADVISFIVSVAFLAQVGDRPGVRQTGQAARRYFRRKSCAGLQRLRPNQSKQDACRPSGTVGRKLSKEIHECLHWLRMNPFAGFGLPLTAGTTLIGQALLMIFLAQAHTEHLSSLAIGMVLAASGAGGALGSAAASMLFRLVGYPPLRIQMWAWTAMFGLLTLSGGQSVIVMAAAIAVLSFTGAMGNIALNTFVVQHAAETMLARVMSVERVTSFAALAVGPALGGILYEQWGTRYAMIALLVATGSLLASASAPPLRWRPF